MATKLVKSLDIVAHRESFFKRDYTKKICMGATIFCRIDRKKVHQIYFEGSAELEAIANAALDSIAKDGIGCTSQHDQCRQISLHPISLELFLFHANNSFAQQPISYEYFTTKKRAAEAAPF